MKNLLILLPILLTSCASVKLGRDEVVDYDKVILLTPGMSGDEVQGILGGQPSSIEFLCSEQKAVWHYSRTDQFGASLGLFYFVSGNISSIAILFDEKGLVERVDGVPPKPDGHKESAPYLFYRMHQARDALDDAEAHRYSEKLKAMGIHVRYLAPPPSSE